MYPRLYMHSIQYVSYNSITEEVIFETRLAGGRRFQFVLIKHQFLALNEAIILIQKHNSDGHFPLGYNTWLHYNGYDGSLYRELNNGGRVTFIFTSFDEYIAFTHARLLLVIRSTKNEKRTGRRKRNVQGRIRGRGVGRFEGEEKSESESSHHQRPLSVVLQPAHQSSTSKRARRSEREAASRSTDNAVMSNNGEESVVFPEWHSATSRRRSDSFTSAASVMEDISSPEIVRLHSSTSSDSMESE